MLWKVSAVAAIALLVFMEIRTSQADALQQPGTIRITDRETAFSRIDVGRRGRSPGDVETTRRLLYNKRIKPAPIGRSEMVCTVVARNIRNCTATYTLPAGKITVAGNLQYRQFFLLAVTGGTGRYNNVRGTLTVTSLSRRPRRSLVLFRLVIS